MGLIVYKNRNYGFIYMNMITKSIDRIVNLLKSVEIDIIYFLLILFSYSVNKDGCYLLVSLVFALSICILYRINFYDKINLYSNEDNICVILLIILYSFLHLYFVIVAENLSDTYNTYVCVGIYIISILKLCIITLKIFFSNILVGFSMLLYIGLLVIDTSDTCDIILNILQGILLYLFMRSLDYEGNNHDYNLKGFIDENWFELLMLIFILISMVVEPYVAEFIINLGNGYYKLDSKTNDLLRYIIVYFLSIIFLLISKGVFDFSKRW